MGRAKDIVIKPISSRDANRIIKSLHYSGKVVPNSQLHLGVFLDGKCGGALQFGPSINKRGTINVVKGTGWNEFIELNSALQKMIKDKDEKIIELNDLYENQLKIQERFIERLIEEIYIYFGIKLVKEVIDEQ